MGTYVGADWASNGWVAAELDENDELSVGFYPTIWNLWYDYEDAIPEQILVDIPIGLPKEGRRECDREAKDELGDRRSCVFWTPIREAVYEDNIKDAKEIQEDETGNSISNQAWAIVPRIREVDTFLRESEVARELVRESHPEICFSALSDNEGVGLKSDRDGLDTRREMLCNELGIEPDACDETVAMLTQPEYAPSPDTDDVLDAMILAITAGRVANDEYSTLPDNPSKDGEGIPMEIVYPKHN